MFTHASMVDLPLFLFLSSICCSFIFLRIQLRHVQCKLTQVVVHLPPRHKPLNTLLKLILTRCMVTSNRSTKNSPFNPLFFFCFNPYTISITTFVESFTVSTLETKKINHRHTPSPLVSLILKPHTHLPAGSTHRCLDPVVVDHLLGR